jgi:GNAT superfamily N-acetyltransferase
MLEIVSARQRPEELHRLCSVAETDKKNRAKDNYSTDWQDKPHTLLWKFYNGMYKPCIGDYYLLYSEDKQLMGGSGFYLYDNDVALGMTRFYVMPGFERQWIGRHMLKEQMGAAKRMHARRMLISFNDYNKKIYDIYVNHIEKLPAIWSVFKPVGLMEINHCMQYCCEATL